jgi:hypothetical protein
MMGSTGVQGKQMLTYGATAKQKRICVGCQWIHGISIFLGRIGVKAV